MATKRPILTNEQKFSENDRWTHRAAFATSLLSVLCFGVVCIVAALLAFQYRMIWQAVITFGLGIGGTAIIHVFFMAIWSHFIDTKIIRNKLHDLEKMNNKEELDL